MQCLIPKRKRISKRLKAAQVRGHSLNEVNWDLRCFPVKQKLFFRDTVLAFKCMTGQAPPYLSGQLTTRLKVTGRVTRSCQLLNIPLYKSSTGQRTFYYHMVHIWNNRDSTLKTAKSISTLKFYLKNKLITDFLNGTSWQYFSILLVFIFFILFYYNLT